MLTCSRAAQEGIAFSFRYGLDIMKETGINPQLMRAGRANMFLSRIFRETLSEIYRVQSIHLYNTDGSIGAARGAGIGCGYYKSPNDAFQDSLRLGIIEQPNKRIPKVLKRHIRNGTNFCQQTLSQKLIFSSN